MAYQPRAAGPAPEQRVRNQRTQALMRRDITWQIAVPLGLAVVAVLVLMALLILPVGAPVRSVWADISLIFLIVPTAFLGLVALAVLAGLVYGLRWALRELPYYFKIGQDFVALLAYRVNGIAEKVAGVFLSLRSFSAGVKRAGQSARSLLTVRRSK